jgi:hypothetical protein
MSRRRPAWNQSLFAFVWHDPADDRPDDPSDDIDDAPPPGPPPLRARVRTRHGPRTALLWGIPIDLSNHPARRERPHARSGLRRD